MKPKNAKILVIFVVSIILVASFSVVVFWGGENGFPEDETLVDDDVNGGDDGIPDDEDVQVPELRLPEEDANISAVVVGNDTITYTYSSDPGELDYVVDDIIAGTTGFGYLRRVTEVQREGDVVVISTENASLADVVDEFNITVNQTLDLGGVETRSSETRSVRTFNLDIELYKSQSTTVNFFGEATISNPRMGFEVDYGITKGLQWLLFSVEQTYTCSIGVEATQTIAIERDKTLASYYLPPITVPVGPVPVVLTPKLEIVTGAELNIQGGMRTSIDMSLTVTTGIYYTPSSGWRPFSNIQRNTDFEQPNADLSAEAKAYVALPKFSLLIYGSVGPFAEIQPYLSFTASSSANPWWTIHAGIEANLGIDIKINYLFGTHTVAQVKMTVLDVKWLIAQAPLKTAPGAPRNLALTSGNAQVFLSWQAPSSDGGSAITGYRIYRGTTSGGTKNLVTTVSGTSYTNTGLTNGQTYYYQVSATNNIGEGSRSAESNAIPATVPGAPRNLAVTSGNAQVSLSWQTPSSNGGSAITGYKIYWGTTSGNLPNAISVAGTSYTHTDRTNGQTYYYHISAINTVGEGAKSSEASAIPTSDPTVPSAPQNLVATPGNETVSLSWQPPSSDGGGAITGYKIYWGTTSGNLPNTISVTGTSYTHTNRTNGQIYYYKISASNSLGEGPQTAEASVTPSAGGGVGTSENPYLIYDVWDLQSMNNNLAAHYALANDIDASFTSSWNSGAGFVPIGDGTTPFTGSFDGRNHAIAGLYINRPTNGHVGLFGYIIMGSVVKNLCLTDIDVSGSEWVGGLVGSNFGGNIQNLSATGNVRGWVHVGGLVGWNTGILTSSYATGNVTGTGNHVGGLVGHNSGTVEDSVVTASSSGDSYVGGLIGTNTAGSVRFSYATGTTTGTDRVGGLIGYNENGTIFDSFATGVTVGVWYVGGLVGCNRNGTVSNSYAMGNTTGNGFVGGLLGLNYEGSVSNSYATGTTTGTWDHVGGLVGYNDYGSVSDSYATGTTTGTDRVGGLIGYNENGTIFDSFATGVTVGVWYVGGLVGCNRNGTVSNSYAMGNTTGNGFVGGLLGLNYEGSVSNSYATGTTTGTWDHVGGLVGYNDYGSVSDSYATGTTTGTDRVGGLIGYNENGTIFDSFATGVTVGVWYVGGLVGCNRNGTVSNSYAMGNTTGNGFVGGLLGLNYEGSVSNSYATGTTTGTWDHVGGLVGYNDYGSVSDSYATGTTTGTDRVGGLIGYNENGTIFDS
ncbi:MAG: fibronectin type III domain-containing protein, partial [Candidatus Thermoplasmatota archaeon]|nr:fibronectin type III domain-containing protein [Candidatus Thermoplasmatota archaeon]